MSWSTLTRPFGTHCQLLKPEDKPSKNTANQLKDAFEKIIAVLDEKKYVRGDLRSNNIMISNRRDGQIRGPQGHRF